jgi:hypothetical protein
MRSIENRLQHLERSLANINPFVTGRYHMVVTVGVGNGSNAPYGVLDTTTGQHVPLTETVRQWCEDARMHGNREIRVVIHSDNKD